MISWTENIYINMLDTPLIRDMNADFVYSLKSRPFQDIILDIVVIRDMRNNFSWLMLKAAFQSYIQDRKFYIGCCCDISPQL